MTNSCSLRLLTPTKLVQLERMCYNHYRTEGSRLVLAYDYELNALQLNSKTTGASERRQGARKEGALDRALNDLLATRLRGFFRISHLLARDAEV
jgi:hypothetical protein